MDTILENIQILIPIALFIAFRIIRSKSEQAKKQQKKASDQKREELVRKIKEAQRVPEYRKALTEDTLVYIPPKPSAQPKAGAKPAPARPAARRVEEKKINKPKAELKSAEVKIQERLPSEIKTQIDQTASAAADQRPASTASHSLKTGFSLQGLSPLQQALVWSEILGQPKGECI